MPDARELLVTTGSSWLNVRGRSGSGRAVDVRFTGAAARLPLDLRALLTHRAVGPKVSLEQVVLAVEGANGSTDFQCRTLADGTHLHHYAAPTGAPALLLLHALGGNGLTWLPLVELLRGSCQLYCLDLPGHGSTPADAATIGGETLARWLERTRSELGLDRVHLVGHSLGARAAAAYAQRFPHRVSSLTMLAPALRPARDLRATAVSSAARLMTMLPAPGVSRRVVGLLLRGMLVRKEGLNRVFLDYAISDVLRDQGTAHYAGLSGGLRWLRREPSDDVDWAALTPRMLVKALLGEQDRYCRPAEHGYLASAGVDVELVPGAGHLLPLEVPVMCAAAVRLSVGLAH